MKKNEVIEILGSKDIPITGVSALCELPSVKEGFSPTDILEGAASIICYGVPIPKGIIYADSNDLALYWRYCNMIYRSLDIASIQLCLALVQGKT